VRSKAHNEAASRQAGPRYDVSDLRPMCRPEHPPNSLPATDWIAGKQGLRL